MPKSPSTDAQKSMRQTSSNHASICLNPCIELPQTMGQFFATILHSSFLIHHSSFLLPCRGDPCGRPQRQRHTAQCRGGSRTRPKQKRCAIPEPHKREPMKWVTRTSPRRQPWVTATHQDEPTKWATHHNAANFQLKS